MFQNPEHAMKSGSGCEVNLCLQLTDLTKLVYCFWNFHKKVGQIININNTHGESIIT